MIKDTNDLTTKDTIITATKQVLKEKVMLLIRKLLRLQSLILLLLIIIMEVNIT